MIRSIFPSQLVFWPSDFLTNKRQREAFFIPIIISRNSGRDVRASRPSRLFIRSFTSFACVSLFSRCYLKSSLSLRVRVTIYYLAGDSGSRFWFSHSGRQLITKHSLQASSTVSLLLISELFWHFWFFSLKGSHDQTLLLHLHLSTRREIRLETIWTSWLTDSKL